MKKQTLRNHSFSPKPIKKYSTGISQAKKRVLNEWVNYLVPKIGSSVEDFIRSGLIPFKLLQVFCPSLSLKGYQSTPNGSQAYNNILLVNNFIFSEFPNSELPAPSEILKKGSSECWILINSIFKNYQMREVKKNWEKCIEWYRSILKLYNIELTKQAFTTQCLNGVYFACVLNCYTGFKLADICKKPNQPEAVHNLMLVFQALKDKIFQPLPPSEFFKCSDEDLVSLTIFEVFKNFRFDVPTLPSREKAQFKNLPQLVINSSDSLISISSWESLEYSKSTILSKEPSESQLLLKTTPKLSKEKPLEIITDDSTGYSMQPYEVSYETVSAANTSYSKAASDKLSSLEKVTSTCERKCMYIADLRTRKERITEVPSLKKLRSKSKNSEPDFLCFLITPRLLKMLKPEHNNFIFTVTMDLKNFSMKKEDYFFEWKTFDLKVKGKIKVSEICSCHCLGRVLNISTFHQELAIQCLDEKECKNYVNGLNKLSKPKTLFSRDVSCNELILNIR